MFATLNTQSPILQPAVKVSGKLCHRSRWAVWLLVAIVLLVLAGYVFRAPLLTGLARAWVVNDPVAKADAIVILGGGVENRPFAAAKLFHDGVAPTILCMNVLAGPAERLGVIPSEKELTRQILVNNQVPASAIQTIGTNVASTYDESLAVRAWLKKTGATSIVIATDSFHTRRARWIFRHELCDTPVKIYVSGVDPVRYKMDNWWQYEDGRAFFQNEIIKSIYYRIKY